MFGASCSWRMVGDSQLWSHVVESVSWFLLRAHYPMSGLVVPSLARTIWDIGIHLDISWQRSTSWSRPEGQTATTWSFRLLSRIRSFLFRRRGKWWHTARRWCCDFRRAFLSCHVRSVWKWAPSSAHAFRQPSTACMFVETAGCLDIMRKVRLLMPEFWHEGTRWNERSVVLLIGIGLVRNFSDWSV